MPSPFPCRARGAVGGPAGTARARRGAFVWLRGCGAAAPLARRGEQKGPAASRSRSGGAMQAQGAPSPTAVCPHLVLLVPCYRWPRYRRVLAAPPLRPGAGGRGSSPPTAGRGCGCFGAILSQGPRSIGMSSVELLGSAVRVWGCWRRVPAIRSPWDCRWRAKHLSPRSGRRASPGIAGPAPGAAAAADSGPRSRTGGASSPKSS